MNLTAYSVQLLHRNGAGATRRFQGVGGGGAEKLHDYGDPNFFVVFSLYQYF